jgi:hypothetical protein
LGGKKAQKKGWSFSNLLKTILKEEWWPDNNARKYLATK